MEKLIKGFNNFDSKTNESLFSGEQEEDVTPNETSFSNEEEEETSSANEEETNEETNEEEEEASFGENELTGDNEMLDTDDDQIDDEIQQDGVTEQTPDTFNPNVSMTPQDWSIVKFMTDGGMRLGMDYSNEIDQNVEIVAGNLDFQSCCDQLDSLSSELGIAQHDNSIENYLGGLSKAMIKKPNTGDTTTSYGGGVE